MNLKTFILSFVFIVLTHCSFGQITNKNTFSKPDSLNQATLSRLNSETAKLNKQLDSLGKVTSLTAGQYKHKTDSLYQNFSSTILGKTKMPGDSLTPAVKEHISELETSIQKRKSSLDSLFHTNGTDLNSPLTDRYKDKLPSLSLPTSNTGSLAIPSGTLQSMNVPTLNTQNLNAPLLHDNASLPEINIPKADVAGLGEVQEKIQDATGAFKDVEGYKSDITKLSQNDASDLTKIPQAAEEQAMKVQGVKQLQSEIGSGDALKKEIESVQEKAKDPKALQAEAMEKARKEYVDHLAGHEQEVKAGTDHLFKLQKKYKSLADSRYLPKGIQNKMKGRPWQERLAPGFFFQASHQLPNWTGIDISPYLGYKVSGRIRTYIGGSYRAYIDARDVDLNSRDKAYAFRWFTHLRAIGGFYGHVEWERKKEIFQSKIPTVLVNDPHIGKWTTHWYTGIANIRNINKKMNSTVIVLYDLTKVGHAFNFNQVAIRFGFEYRLTKKKEITEKQSAD